MKKTLSFLLAFLLIAALWGCNPQEPPLESPAKFYYPVDSSYRKNNDMVIKSELREGTGYKNNLLAFTDRYMNGPVSGELISIFPEDCYPVSICKNGETITVYMSPSFAKLTGIDLTLACACLSVTLMDFTGVSTVNICVKDTKLDGHRTIVMTRDSFCLQDETLTEATESQ